MFLNKASASSSSMFIIIGGPGMKLESLGLALYKLTYKVAHVRTIIAGVDLEEDCRNMIEGLPDETTYTWIGIGEGCNAVMHAYSYLPCEKIILWNPPAETPSSPFARYVSTAKRFWKIIMRSYSRLNVEVLNDGVDIERCEPSKGAHHLWDVVKRDLEKGYITNIIYNSIYA
jgi:hypothetical protein